MSEKQNPLVIPETVMLGWQELLNLMAEIIGIPAALIMRITGDYIEVFVSSLTEDNPYHPGDKEYLLNSGLYCETVIKTKEKLLVPNALKDEKWKNNPDVKLNMISYLGFPILLPNREPFGTICVLDNKENSYKSSIETLITKFRDMIQYDIELLNMNQSLGDENRKLTDYLIELQALRGIVPICAKCKSIRDKENNWHPIEKYFLNSPETKFTHSLCPTCVKEYYVDKE